MNASELPDEALFEAALNCRTPAERAAYLDQVCAGQPELRRQLEVLLAAHDRSGDFLEPAAATARPTLKLDLAGEEAPGMVIGRYKLLEKIGEGGVGVVYMAEQTEPIRRRVALKVIKLGMDTKSVVARFEAERQALALMDHPNIAKVLDAGATDTGRPFFVMELVRGIRITNYCDQNSLSTKQRLDLFVQVCHAVQHAHQKGIIHRDIKPSNILVTLHDGVPVPKVIDFGIAKATQQPLTDKTLFTAYQQFIGTPAYMSPEQAELSALDIDTRCDIYSLGVLLYELLTGKTPFEQKDLLQAGLDEMRRWIREKEPPRPSTRLSTLTKPELTDVARHRGAEAPKLIPLVRGDLDWIVMKCLEKDRRRRYETANNVALDIEHHLRHEPVSAAAPSTLYRGRKFVRRHKVGLAVAAGMVTLLTGGVMVSTWQAVRATRAERAQALLRQEAEAGRKEARTEAAKSEQVARFLKDTLKGVGPSVALGRDTTMLKEILDQTAAHVGDGLKDQPEVEIELRNTIGSLYSELGQNEKAQEMHRRALELARELPGKRRLEVASSLDSLAMTGFGGDLAALEAMERQALAIRRELLGDQHSEVAASLNHLGILLLWQGKREESEALQRQALTLRKKILGEQSPEVARSVENLGDLFVYLGMPAEAEPMYRKALALSRRVLGNEHPAVALYLGDVARALEHQGKAAEAEPLHRETVAIERKVLGDNHPRLAQSIEGLADCLWDQGKLPEAETLHREALAKSKVIHGVRHPAVASLGHKLGRVLRAQGKMTEANSLAKETLEVEKRLSDQAHITLAAWLTWQANGLRLGGRLADAEVLGRHASSLLRETPGGEVRDSLLADSLSGLGQVLSSQGRIAEVEPLCREALALQRVLPPTETRRMRLAGLLTDLANTLRDGGKLTEARSLYRESLEAAKKLPPSPDLAKVLASFGDMLRDEGKPAEAEPLYREGLDLCRRLAPNDLETRQWLAGGLGFSLRSQGKLAEAELLYREALTNAAKLWPDDFKRWEWHFNNLVDVLQCQGKLAEPDQLIHEFLAPVGPTPPQSALLLVVQADLRGRQGRWKEAIETCTRAIELEPTNHLSYHKLAPLLVFTGDLERYRQLCRQMLVRFSRTANPVVADVTAKNCLLLPPSAGDLPTVAGLAETAVAAGTDHAYRVWFHFSKGLADYRQGHFTGAAEWMQRVVATPGKTPELAVSGHVVLAMAQHQLQRPDEAQAALNQALALEHTTLPQLDQGSLGPEWVNWLNAQILLREAKALLAGQPAPAGNKSMP
jgi:eukaryotic-like serine/threonine-protein kinase